MKLLEFFNSEMDVSKRSILGSAVIAGAASAVLLGVINAGAERAANQEVKEELFWIFIASFLLFFITKKYALSAASIAVEAAVRKVRIRIADKIRKSDLSFVENMGRSSMFTRLTQDANLISQSAVIIINASQSAIVLVTTLMYVAWLSPVGFLIILVALGTGSGLYLVNNRKNAEAFEVVNRKESEFFDALNHLLSGFKEIKVNQRKSDSLFEHIQNISVETEKLKVTSGLRFIVDFMFSQVTFYLLLAIIVFILPQLEDTHYTIVIKLTASALFIIGPVNLLVGAIPIFTLADVAVRNLYKLEQELDAQGLNTQTLNKRVANKMAAFREIRFDNVYFTYETKDHVQGTVEFSVGPLNFVVERGNILFLTGGNGSGKSTVLKLITGLYYPTSGRILVDGVPVTRTNYPEFRNAFSLIFSDFHLFDRLYGLEGVDEDTLEELLQLMQLEQKTAYRDGRFTDLNLSTGQKKRLAFIAASLEDKPISVFDEWAADQDATFRAFFYEKILPDMRAQGKTLVCVTHDDRYFHECDHLIKMEMGKVILDNPEPGKQA
ncbi:MAG: cyclic peptide export ABC transporter [Magnetococcales bacterium]|nr:cyclic peptide export ABC transporter [Magnetococcales bacterium]